MSGVNLLDNEDLYDSIDLGGVRSPGVVSISGHTSKENWDVKDGAGQNGASMTRKGRKPCVFQCSFYLADRDDFAAWPAFRAAIEATVSSKAPKAVDIYHPDLADVGIKSVVKGEVKGAEYDRKGGVTRVVEFTEYMPPKPAGGSPSGSASKAGNPAKNDPNADLKRQVAELTEEYKNTRPFTNGGGIPTR